MGKGRPPVAVDYEKKIASLIPKDTRVRWKDLAQTAAELGIGKKTLSHYLKKFQKYGWLKRDIDTRQYYWSEDEFDSVLIAAESEVHRIIRSGAIESFWAEWRSGSREKRIELHRKMRWKVVEIIRLWHQILLNMTPVSELGRMAIQQIGPFFYIGVFDTDQGKSVLSLQTVNEKQRKRLEEHYGKLVPTRPLVEIAPSKS